MLIIPHREIISPPGLFAREELRRLYTEERRIYVPGHDPCPLTRQAITVVNIGTGLNASGGGASATIAGVTAPAGALLVVAVYERSTGGTGIGTLSDGTSNTYSVTATARPNNSTALGIGSIFWSKLGTALNSNVLNYTKGANGAATCLSAFYATNPTGWPASPLDLNPTANGSGTLVSVSSGTPSISGELFTAFAAFSVASGSYTQDSTHNWVTPFVAVSTGSANLGGGDQIGGAASIVFSPVVTSSSWAGFIATFKPNAATTFVADQIFQLPVFKRRVALDQQLKGDDGIQSPYQRWFNTGWEVQPPQPPPRTRTPKPPLDPQFKGEDGIQAPYINWRNVGFEVQPPQPPHPRPERFASIAAGDSGIEAPFVFVGPPVVFVGWGFEPILPMLRAWPTVQQRYPGTKGRSEFAIFQTWQNMGWEVQPPQPPHPRSERFGATLGGDSGTEAPFVFVAPTFFPYGWEVAPPQPPHPRLERITALLRGIDGTDAAFINWLNAGWEVQSPQPPHPRPERFGAIVIGEQGNELPYILWRNAGWDPVFPQPPHPRPERFGAIVVGDHGDQSPFVQWLNAGWEPVFLQPPHPRPERSGAIVIGDQGDQSPFTLWLNAGWELPSPQPPHPRVERFGAIVVGDSGIVSPFTFIAPVFVAWAWEPVLPLVPHPRVEGRFAGIAVGDQGIVAPYIFVPPPTPTGNSEWLIRWRRRVKR